MQRRQGLSGGDPRTGYIPIFDGPHLVRSAVLRGSRPIGLLGVGIDDGRSRFNYGEATGSERRTSTLGVVGNWFARPNSSHHLES